MIHSRRTVILLGFAIICITLLPLRSKINAPWRAKVNQVRLDSDPKNMMEKIQYPDVQIVTEPLSSSSPTASKGGKGDVGIDMVNLHSIFVPGRVKPPGSNYTRNLVVAKTKAEEAGWLYDQNLDNVERKVYIVDDPKAPLHPPKNKGHEVMVYLTYIIDHYDNLPDVSIFMHAHRYAWHNNDILNNDAVEMIRRLSSERVQREGYMNLRCHWMPGCPEWMHPRNPTDDINKKEEGEMAHAWAELFPNQPVPEVLSQPCCGQFALSGDRIRALSKEKYEFYRSWLTRTRLDDWISGRIWEYLWQVVFTGESIFCPNQRTCYCDGFGVCFEDDKKFDYWFELQYRRRMLMIELDYWHQKADKVEEYRRAGKLVNVEGANIAIPEAGRDVVLGQAIATIEKRMDGLRDAAIERGTRPDVRAETAGRVWKEGDGF